MHIYIHLTAEGYQRSFPAIWGWHWYRSYLKPMEHRPDLQIVTRDPSFCRGFGLFPPLACGGARIRRTRVHFSPLSVALAVNFTFIWEHQTRVRARAVTRQFWGRGYLGFPPAQPTPRHAVLFALWCSADQIILNSLQTHFVNVWLIQFKPLATTWYYRGL